MKAKRTIKKIINILFSDEMDDELAVQCIMRALYKAGYIVYDENTESFMMKGHVHED